MPRRKRRVGGSFTQKPNDLRAFGRNGPVVTRKMTPEELEEFRRRKQG